MRQGHGLAKGRARRPEAREVTYHVEALEDRRLLSVEPIVGLAQRTGDSSPQSFTAFNGQVLFTAASNSVHGKLHITDGTSRGTRLLADLAPAALKSGASPFVVVGDKAFFTAFTSASGLELYCTDGTPAGTRIVADLTPGSGSSGVAAMTPLHGQLYFTAAGKLWRTDGVTTANIWPSAVGTDTRQGAPAIHWVTVFRDELYFVGTDAAAGTELRAVDALGQVRLVADVAPGPASGSPRDPTAAADQLFFRANGGSGNELFVTDGTAAGTRQVADINAGPAHSDPAILGAFGDRVFFTASIPNSWGGKLYVSDGTAGGTIPLGVTFSFNPVPLTYTVFDGGLAFPFTEPASGAEPWVSDGTVAGTRRLADLRPGSEGSSPASFGTTADGRAFFHASTPAGLTWWTTDGTAGGTQPFAHPYAPNAPAVLSGKRIVAHAFGTIGLEPAAVDPDTNAVTAFEDINKSLVGPSAQQFTRAGNLVYFGVDGGLWRTDGTGSGTFPLGVTYALGKAAPDGRFFFVNTSQLFVTDGTPAGTQLLGSFPGTVTALALAGDNVVAAVKTTTGNGDVHLYARPQAPATTAPPTLLANFGYQVHHVKFTEALNGRVLLDVKTWSHPRIGHTDGTPGGTVLRSPPNSQYGSVARFIGVTSTAGYFMGWDSNGNEALFRVAGGDITTATQIMPSLGGGMFGGGFIFDDRLIVLANRGLYRSAGATVERYADLPGWTVSGFDATQGLARAAATDDAMYFIASDGTGPVDSEFAGLWKTDGSTVSLVTPVYRADGTKAPLLGLAQSPQRLLATANRVYFDAGGQLYVSDGTSAGTAIEPDGASTKYGEQFAAARAALDDAVITYRAGGNYPLVRIAPDAMASVAGRVFDDADGDGQLDAGEAPRPGRQLYLDVDDDGQLDADEARQLTDAAGECRFGALPAGTYRIRLVPEPNEVLTSAASAVVLAGAEAATLDVGVAGSHATLAWLVAGSAATWDAGTRTLTVTGRTIIAGDLGARAPRIVANSAAADVVFAAGAGARVNLGGLTLSNGATARLSDGLSDCVLVVGDGGLNVSGSSSLDLADNALVVRAGSLPAVQSMLTTGFHGGDWLGGGLTSGTAAADASRATALAYATFGSLGPADFQGVTDLAAGDVVVRHTYYGDTNLDRLVNTDDILNILAAGKLDTGASASWSDGDMTFDGRVDTDDILQILATGKLDE